MTFSTKMWAPALLLLLSALTLSSSLPSSSSVNIIYYNNNTIFQSPASYNTPGTLYARTLSLPSGTLLATWENYSPEPPPVAFPIYSSPDAGVTWSFLSWVNDTQYSYGLRYQPFLYLLPRPFGKWDAGTLFLAGSAIPTDLSSTHIELYASDDDGRSWEFIAHIAAGGEAVPNNGLTPVWEPFLMLYFDEKAGRELLVCYYSDQRDPAYGQKLVHQVSQDGIEWGDIRNDVTYDEYTARPGMPVVARMGEKEGGKYIMTYEYGGGLVDGVVPENYTFPVYYRISHNPLKFNEVEGFPIVTGDAERTVPVSSPYVVYDEEMDILIVSCGTLNDVFVNKEGGNVGSWERKKTEERTSYTRSLRVVEGREGKKGLLIAGGGVLPPSQENRVTVGMIDMQGW